MIRSKAIFFVAGAMTYICVSELHLQKPFAISLGVRGDGVMSLRTVSLYQGHVAQHPKGSFYFIFCCEKSLERTYTNTAFIQFYMVMVPPQRPTDATLLLPPPPPPSSCWIGRIERLHSPYARTAFSSAPSPPLYPDPQQSA